MKPLSDCKLYTFVDTAYLRGRAPEAVARELCSGGADLIQLRAKSYSQQEVRRLTESILPITTAAGIYLVVNDYPDVARELGAELCHLGQEDFFDAGYTQISQLLPQGSRLGIGLSTHSPEQAQRALSAGPDYIAIGPVYATVTKPQAKPVTLDYVRWAAANVTIPWFAIGGITLENLDAVLQAGAQRVCVVSAIMNSSDIAETCHHFKVRLDSPFSPLSAVE
jgi:thiamine-phosphate pyrophosphorylase